MMKDFEKPIFELILGGDFQRHLKIYADGRVVGLKGVVCVIINRIPEGLLLADERVSDETGSSR